MKDLKIKAIIGLGNIGTKYEKTRHNSGFLYLESLNPNNWQQKKDLQAFESSWAGIRLFKPTTMMNLSGNSISKVLDFYKIDPSELALAYDDLDIPLGKWKISKTKIPKVHNGVNSISKEIREECLHIRIGIDNRATKGNKGIPGIRYSLERFKKPEIEVINNVFSYITNSIDEFTTID